MKTKLGAYGYFRVPIVTVQQLLVHPIHHGSSGPLALIASKIVRWDILIEIFYFYRPYAYFIFHA